MKLAGLATIAVVAASISMTPAFAQDLPKTQLKVVGGGSHNYTFNAVEKPFWLEKIPAASKGAIQAEFTGLAESGLKGPEIIRLMRAGALDIALGVFGFVSSDDATFEGIDLAGLTSDIDSARKVADAYKPVIDKAMREKHGIKLLATVPYTPQVFFCRTPVASLDDLKGKKVRAYGSSMSDFVRSAGATPITLPFAEVISALQTKVIDCAVTGIGSGNAAKWYEVAKYLFEMPVGWSVGFYGVSTKRWEALDPKVREFLEKEIAQMENDFWKETDRENRYAFACNTGQGECKVHTQTDMKASKPGEADKKRIAEIVQSVAKNWGARCGAECVKNWNDTAGKVLGISIQ